MDHPPCGKRRRTQRLRATPLSAHATQFFAALDDDLNISGALGHLFDLIRESNTALDRGELSPEQAAQLLSDWKGIDAVLAFQREAASVPGEVLALVDQRQQARAANNGPRGPPPR